MKYKIISDNEMFDKVLYIGESDEPFEEIQKFKRKAFSDLFDKKFKYSQLRNYIKHIMNNGGKLIIEIETK